MQVTIAPTHDLTLGDPFVPSQTSVFFAADGRLYVESVEKVLNVWNVLVYRWPEVLGAMMGLVLLWVLMAIVRAWRRPREAGSLYCSNCNYKLDGLPAGARCSECGADPGKKRPIAGRGWRRRLAVPIVVGTLACIGYGALHLAHVPRENLATSLFWWPSRDVAAFAHANKITWLERHDSLQTTLCEVDPATGKVIREVFRLGRSSAIPVNPSPDGRFGVTTLDQGELATIDLHTGKVSRSVPRPDGKIGRGSRFFATCWRNVIGWSDDRTVWVQFLDVDAPSHKVYRWDIKTGELHQTTDIPIEKLTDKYTRVTVRQMTLIAGTDPPLAWETKDELQEHTAYGKESVIRVRDLSDGRVVSEVSGKYMGTSPAPLANGSLVIFDPQFKYPGESQTNIVLRSYVDGSETMKFSGPGGMAVLGGRGAPVLHDATHRFFVTGLRPSSIRVRDLKSEQWIAILDYQMYALSNGVISVSPDGRWVVTNVSEVIGGPKPSLGSSRPPPTSPPTFKRHVLIFDMGGLDGPSDRTRSVQPDSK